jgi:plastocyanin
VRRRICGIAAVAAFGACASPALAVDQTVHGTDALVWENANPSVAPGETVTWTFDGTQQVHHVAATGSTTADADWASFSSPLAVAQPPVSFTFKNAGVYTFYCSVHKDTMVGSVTVSATPVVTPVPTPLPLSQQAFPNDTPADAPAETAVQVDKAKPTLSSLSAKRATRGAKVRFKVSEDAVTGVVFSRGKKVVKSYVVTGKGTLSFTAKGLKAGKYRVTLVAVDVAGNESKPRTLRVTVR